MDQEMKQVFISYSSKQSELAQKICRYLEDADIPCWIAPRNIAAGSDYTSDLPNAITQCRYFLLVMTEDAQRSGWVCKELVDAQNKNKKIIPFIAQVFTMEEKFNFLLQGNHWVNGSDDPEAALDQVIRTIKDDKHDSKEALPDTAHYYDQSDRALLSDRKLFEKMLKQARRHTKHSAEYYAAMQLAAQGNTDAQYKLGEMYYRDYRLRSKNACYWLKQAASKGHARAMYLLGKCCYYGFGIKKSYGQAIWWYQKSLERDENLAEAMWSLGDCYKKGRGVEEDSLRSAEYYRRAKDTGDVIGTLRYIDLIYLSARQKQKRESIKKIDRLAVRILLTIWAFICFIIFPQPRYTRLKEHGYSVEEFTEEMLANYRRNKLLEILRNGWLKIILGSILTIAGWTLADLLNGWRSNDWIDALCMIATVMPGFMIAVGISTIDTDEDVEEAREFPRLLLHFIIYTILCIIAINDRMGTPFLVSGLFCWLTMTIAIYMTKQS